MAECELLVKCPFFNETLPHMPSTASFLKSKYCRRDYSKCARYTVRHAIGVEKVPTNLYPDETQRANLIIARESA